jgi:hypothetical protein
MKHGTVLVIVDCSAIQVLIAERSGTMPHSELRNPQFASFPSNRSRGTISNKFFGRFAGD